MLKALFGLFSKQTSPSTRKHLVMQTVYLSPVKLNNNTQVSAIKDELVQQETPVTTTNQLAPASTISAKTNPKPQISDTDRLLAQKAALQKKYPGSIIEVVNLDDQSVLIGLTKHPQTIMGGITMYPAAVRFTQKWDAIKHKASTTNANIAYFKPKHPSIECLKITNPSDHTEKYLVNHRVMLRTKALWQPTQTASNQVNTQRK